MTGMMDFEGKNEREAVQKACSAMNLAESELEYSVVDEGSSGLFGLGARPVRIRARGRDETPPSSRQHQASRSEQVTSAMDDQVQDETQSGDEDDIRGGIVGPAPEKAARALEVAKGLAERMGLEAEISVRDEDARIVIVIGEREGSTGVADMLGSSRPPAIPSFQFLLNKIVNRFPEGRKHILVEVPSVPRRAPAERRQRQQPAARSSAPAATPVVPDPDLDPTLVAIGKLLAEKATTLNKVITVHPMLASDRRAVHQTIMGIEGVQTVSEGEGLYRRMHVVPDALRGDRGEAGPGRRRRRRRRRRGAGGGEGLDAGAIDSADGAGEREAEPVA